jgi:hypothetical protein
MGHFSDAVAGLRADLEENPLTKGVVSSDQAMRGNKAAARGARPEFASADRVDRGLQVTLTLPRLPGSIAMGKSTVAGMLAYDKDLHSRMGQSYASQAFLVIRMALRRETLLALMRLWDRNKAGRPYVADRRHDPQERGHRRTSSREGKAIRLAWRRRADACRPSGQCGQSD